MSDITQRLRDLSGHKHDDLSVGDEAADTIEELTEVLDGIMRYFRSGNPVPVERATILANSKEIQAARAAITKTKKEVENGRDNQ